MIAQTPPAKPQFEVASVKAVVKDSRPSKIMRDFVRDSGQPGEIPMSGKDRVRIKNWALLDLIAAAYSVHTTQVSGPEWISDQGFDVEANVPDGTRKEELNAMLQSLLEERFGLKVHRDKKTEKGFALVVGTDGPRLKPAKPPDTPDPDLTEEEQRAQMQQKMLADVAASRKRRQENPGPPGMTESWDSITTEELAAQLVRLAGAPVVDATGLTGEYAVRIRTSTNANGSGDTVFDAVEKLGLKLEPRKVTVDTVVVDQVSKTPTAN
jgi:uncharacterized protein (TIGR03435 family)